ncbi:hypothetical protein K438DRAFT_1714509 [Mycena galopus ATCC 62051]|nr:hypothetical protein K438DRAFT_1714509 [Mycena galopus ATCC 62051]
MALERTRTPRRVKKYLVGRNLSVSVRYSPQGMSLVGIKGILECLSRLVPSKTTWKQTKTRNWGRRSTDDRKMKPIIASKCRIGFRHLVVLRCYERAVIRGREQTLLTRSQTGSTVASTCRLVLSCESSDSGYLFLVNSSKTSSSQISYGCKTFAFRSRFLLGSRVVRQRQSRFKELSGKREVFGRWIQCRTGHGFTGEFYNRFIFSEDVDCPCGEVFQTREHLLCECPQYEGQRHILREASRDLSLPDILGTKEGVAALAKFLEESGAFTKTGKARREPELPVFADEPDPQSDEEDEE